MWCQREKKPRAEQWDRKPAFCGPVTLSQFTEMEAEQCSKWVQIIEIHSSQGTPGLHWSTVLSHGTVCLKTLSFLTRCTGKRKDLIVSPGAWRGTGRRKLVSPGFSSPVCVVHTLSIVLPMAGATSVYSSNFPEPVSLWFFVLPKWTDSSLNVTKFPEVKDRNHCQILLKAMRAFQLIIILFCRSFIGFKCASLHI